MNEATAALIGSIATAFLGLIGIGITQWVSWRTARLRAKESDAGAGGALKGHTQEPELPLIAVPGTSLTSLAVIRLDIEALKLSLARGQAEILVGIHGLASRLDEIGRE
jgi:hypothetical protein